jgi:hypothetical protein
MNRHLRAVLTGAAALLLAVTGAGPATAGDDLWPVTADCAVGAITGHTVTGPPDHRGPAIDLYGWVGPCPPDDKDTAPEVAGEFGFAYLGLGGTQNEGMYRAGEVFDSRLRPYESATGQTTFVGRIDFAVARKAGVDEMPLCLMRDTQFRIACVHVELLSPDLATVTQVAVTDPRVLGRVLVTRIGPATTPNCATCL